MKKIIFAVVCFCVALLPTHILGKDRPKSLKKSKLLDKLENIQRSGGTINDVFKPSENGFLGKGFTSMTYKGVLSIGTPPTNMEVAMKFTFDCFRENARGEYGAYTCLNAINNKIVETYGIPSVWYFGYWETYTLMAITLLDIELNEICVWHDLTKLDFLIICREIVRILKYIHRHGILQTDLQTTNIMFRNNRLFLIDFTAVSKFYFNDSFVPSEGMSLFELETPDEIGIEHTKYDWQNFLLHIGEEMENARIEDYAMSKISEFKFAISDDQEKLNYNELYERINREINAINRNGTTKFSWVEDEQEQNDSEEEPIQDFYSIEEPLDQANFRYPKINYNYFAGAGTSSGGSTSVDSNANP